MKNIPEFEGLRGFLSTVVVVAHLHPSLVTWVWGSMDVFFCMSGFLIGQLIFRNQSKRDFIREYAWRRITRIWPAYYATFGACLLLAFLFWRVSQRPIPWPPGLGNALSLVFLQNTEMLFHPNFVAAGPLHDYLPFMSHTWSVALEEQFYLLAPVICWMLARLRRPWFGAAILAVSCCTLGSILRHEGFYWWVLPARFDGFAVGIFVAAVIHHQRITGQRSQADVALSWILFIAGGGTFMLLNALLPHFEFNQGGEMMKSPIIIYGIASVAVFSGGLLLLVNHYAGHSALVAMRLPPLLSLGRMSYSTYLAHIPVLWYLNTVMEHWAPLTIFQKFLIQLLLCFGGAYALYILVERPVMQRRGLARRDAADTLTAGLAP